MPKRFSTPFASPFYPGPPYHYKNSKVLLALFNPTESSVEKMLPAPLRPSQLPLAALFFAEHPCQEIGTFMEAALIVQCLFDNPDTGDEEVGAFFSHVYVDNDIAQASGREIWGYARKNADISMTMKKNRVEASVVRNGHSLLKASCILDEEGEWIDSGPNINFKVIPSASGESHDVAFVTATYVTIDVHEGRSGEVEIDVGGGPQDDFSAVEIDAIMLGQYFDCDFTVPPGKVVGELEL
ncbi:MAG: acetoacetate decarboxylase family protein [Candidatus Thorarchaeota archaeon]